MKPVILLLAAALVLPMAVGHAAGPKPPQADPTQADNVADFLTNLHDLVDYLSKSPHVVVAEIGGQTITHGDVAEALRALPPTDGAAQINTIYHDVVNGLMAQRALIIRAHQQGLDKDPIVLRRIAAATDTILGNEYLRHTLAPTVTDAALHAAYDRQFAGKPGPVQVRARIIVTATQAEAMEVMARLRTGDDFADLARKLSEDSSASGGGDLGFIRQEAIAPEVGAVLFTLAPGQVNFYPIHAANAWFIVKSEARQMEPTPSLDAVKGWLTQQLMRESTPAAARAAMTGLPRKVFGMVGQ